MSNLAEATSRLVNILADFSSEERLRIVKASLTLLGDEFTPSSGQPEPQNSGQQNQGNPDYGNSNIPLQVRQWMNKNGVSEEQLEHFYHFDQGRAIPIALPGSAKSKREKTINAYIATGLASYLISGDASFSDAEARKFCEESGCYDSPNHTKALKALGNKVTGSKHAGWKLTTPGLTAAAELVKTPIS